MTEPSDLLRGVAEIQQFARFPSYSAAYHACRKGFIPAFQVGHVWYARRSTLNAFFERKERKALAAE